MIDLRLKAHGLPPPQISLWSLAWSIKIHGARFYFPRWVEIPMRRPKNHKREIPESAWRNNSHVKHPSSLNECNRYLKKNTYTHNHQGPESSTNQLVLFFLISQAVERWNLEKHPGETNLLGESCGGLPKFVVSTAICCFHHWNHGLIFRLMRFLGATLMS